MGNFFKKSAKKVGKFFKKVAKKIAKGVKRVAKKVGRAIKKGLKKGFVKLIMPLIPKLEKFIRSKIPRKALP